MYIYIYIFIYHRYLSYILVLICYIAKWIGEVHIGGNHQSYQPHAVSFARLRYQVALRRVCCASQQDPWSRFFVCLVAFCLPSQGMERGGGRPFWDHFMNTAYIYIYLHWFIIVDIIICIFIYFYLFILLRATQPICFSIFFILCR